jgi:hypothetical protein
VRRCGEEDGGFGRWEGANLNRGEGNGKKLERIISAVAHTALYCVVRWAEKGGLLYIGLTGLMGFFFEKRPFHNPHL